MSASSTQSSTDICNYALSLISVELINSIDDSGTTSLQCKQFFNFCLDLVLRDIQPAEAIKTASLAADGGYTATDTDYEFSYRYKLPETPYCIALLTVNGVMAANVTGDGTIELQGRAIYTNFTAPILIRYIARLTDLSLLPPEFVECVAYQLAAKLAYIKHKDSARQRELLLQYRELIRPAGIAAVNTIAPNKEPIRESDFLKAFSLSQQLPTVDTSHLGADPTA